LYLKIPAAAHTLTVTTKKSISDNMAKAKIIVPRSVSVIVSQGL
jgi:hypothetical protein